MQFPDDLTSTIDQVIGKPLNWEYGRDHAELSRVTDINDARKAVQFMNCYYSCFQEPDDGYGFVPSPSPKQAAMIALLEDDKFNLDVTQSNIEALRKELF